MDDYNEFDLEENDYQKDEYLRAMSIFSGEGEDVLYTLGQLLPEDVGSLS